MRGLAAIADYAASRLVEQEVLGMRPEIYKFSARLAEPNPQGQVEGDKHHIKVMLAVLKTKSNSRLDTYFRTREYEVCVKWISRR